MNPILLGPLLEVGTKLIDRLIPDKQAQAEAKLKLLELQQAGELKQLESDMQLALGQLEVNKTEAATTSLFRGGWRPFIGWICGSGLAFQFVVRPLANWTIAVQGGTVFLPGLELDTLMTLLFGMLGLGVYRTAEKLKGIN